MRILVTGACGFIGHHIVEELVSRGHEVVALDRLDETSTMERLSDAASGGKVKFVWHDLRSPINALVSHLIGPVQAIYHLAASTHVDRSITNSIQFVLDNVLGTANLLEYARSLNDLRILVNFSTDEVFGPAPAGVAYKETDRYDARNPYSATKAGAEELAHAYANTYGLPVLTTHCMNVFGERQHPEKFVPLVVRSLVKAEIVPIHVAPNDGPPGTRFYIYSKDISVIMANILDLAMKGVDLPSKLNIPGCREVDNLAMAQLIAKHAGMYLGYELVDFHSTRPGHDLRYALDGTRLEELGLANYTDFDESVGRTVAWYLSNRDWLLR